MSAEVECGIFLATIADAGKRQTPLTSADLLGELPDLAEALASRPVYKMRRDPAQPDLAATLEGWCNADVPAPRTIVNRGDGSASVAVSDPVTVPIKSDVDTIAELRRNVTMQQEMRAQVLSELIQATRDRDILARRCREQSKQLLAVLQRPALSATDAVDAIMARADEDGAMHRDAMIEVLKSMGAR